MKYFLDSPKYDLVLITNSDIQIDKDKAKCISDAIHISMSKPEIGGLGFLENSDKNSNFYEGTNMSGFLFVISRDVVSKVGFLDEGFYMYGEEQDYFSRVLNAGFKLLQSGVIVNHKAEGSGKSSIKNSWYAIRNSIFLDFKTKKLKKIIRKIIALFALINRVYKPNNLDDPSYIRITRPGIFFGNMMIIGAIFWNLKKSLNREKYD